MKADANDLSQARDGEGADEMTEAEIDDDSEDTFRRAIPYLGRSARIIVPPIIKNARTTLG